LHLHLHPHSIPIISYHIYSYQIVFYHIISYHIISMLDFDSSRSKRFKQITFLISEPIINFSNCKIWSREASNLSKVIIFSKIVKYDNLSHWYLQIHSLQ
jgi:hypothetical protein